MASLLEQLEQSQKAERELYATLRSDKGTLTADQREALVADINKESAKRREYYAELEKNAESRSSYQKEVAGATASQEETLKLLEDQLDSAKTVLNSLMDEKQDKMKMIQINTYFGKKYAGYSGLMIAICVVLLLQLIPFAVEKYLNAPEIASYISKAIWGVGGLSLAYLWVDVAWRRNDNYDEYRWWLAPTTVADMNDINASSGDIVDISGVDIPELCMGSYCCGPGTSWDDASGCVINDNAAETV